MGKRKRIFSMVALKLSNPLHQEGQLTPCLIAYFCFSGIHHLRARSVLVNSVANRQKESFGKEASCTVKLENNDSC